MSTGKWTDETSYSRDERGKVEPRAWQLDGCDFRVTVHRLHGCPGWYLSAPDANIDRRFLGNVGLEVARSNAIDFVRSKLASMVVSLDAARSR